MEMSINLHCILDHLTWAVTSSESGVLMSLISTHTFGHHYFPPDEAEALARQLRTHAKRTRVLMKEANAIRAQTQAQQQRRTETP